MVSSRPLHSLTAAIAVEAQSMPLRFLDISRGGIACGKPQCSTSASHDSVEVDVGADDTTVPVLAKGKTAIGRLSYLCAGRPTLRRHRPAGRGLPLLPQPLGRVPAPTSCGPTAASCRPTPSRATTTSTTRGASPFPSSRRPGWSYGRRKLFDIAKLDKAPIALEAVRRIDEIFAIERTIRGRSATERLVPPTGPNRHRGEHMTASSRPSDLRPRRFGIALMCALAAVVGVVTGLGALLFRVMISFVHNLFFLPDCLVQLRFQFVYPDQSVGSICHPGTGRRRRDRHLHCCQFCTRSERPRRSRSDGGHLLRQRRDQAGCGGGEIDGFRRRNRQRWPRSVAKARSFRLDRPSARPSARSST